MKTNSIFTLGALALLAAGCASEKPKQAPVPWVANGPVGANGQQAAPPPNAGQAIYVYNQQLMPQQVALYSTDQAQAIVDAFRANYPKLGNPRMLIYVNRELVDEQSGMKVSARSEHVETTRTVNEADTGSSTNLSTKTTANNTYANGGKSAPTLTDRQTVRDVERLMGRPFRSAGVALADQGVASQSISNRPLDSITTENEQARKDREAVAAIADVVVEVLISSRNVTVAELNGDKTYPVPDIQATAVRLKDAKVIGQASAAEVMNKAGGPASVARNFTVQDITEATSLALMENMLQEAK